jgi:hypothetical protein
METGNKYLKQSKGIAIGILIAFLFFLVYIVIDISMGNEGYSLLFFMFFILPVLIILSILAMVLRFKGKKELNGTNNQKEKDSSGADSLICFITGLVSFFLPSVTSLWLIKIGLMIACAIFFVKQIKIKFSYLALIGVLLAIGSLVRLILFIRTF